MGKKINKKNFVQQAKKIVTLLSPELKGGSILIGFLVLFITLSFIFIKTHEEFAANFADTVLRPILGNTVAIAIESAFFKMEDTANHIYYTFKTPQAVKFDTKSVAKNTLQVQATFSFAPITSLHFFPKLLGEDVWTPIDNSSTASGLMVKTFVRPDPSRDYATVALVKLNLQKLALGIVAGTWEPGEVDHRGPGKIPLRLQQSNMLVAAFNGGFQKKDGNYGMIVGDITYLPLQKGLATIVLYKNTPPKILTYSGQNLGKNVIAVRQNGPLILQNGKVIPSPNEDSILIWGRTTTNSMYTWRSGIGITKDNDLVYAVGPSLVPQTLAKALQAAGAVNAMQLDINPVWVRFVTYHALGNGRYTDEALLQDMVNGGNAYLYGYQKDFFYVYKTS